MRTGWAMAMLCGLLTACSGGSNPTGSNTVTPVATPDPMETKIAALNDIQRKSTFYKAIYDADYECREIVKVDVKPRDAGKPVWLATCDDNGEYVITLQPGGIFTVSGVEQPKRRLPKGTVIMPVGTK